MSMTIRLLCVAAALAAAAAHAQSTVYRWVDKDGKVQFSDSPPPADAKGVSERRIGTGGGDDSQLPYATQVAMKRHPVTLYTGTDCGDFCARGRNLLTARGVPFVEKNAQTDQAAADALEKISGGRNVPVLVVGESNTKGFDEENWNAMLDRAGYLKTRLPGQPTARTEAAAK
jgi:glutaredoxin